MSQRRTAVANSPKQSNTLIHTHTHRHTERAKGNLIHISKSFSDRPVDESSNLRASSRAPLPRPKTQTKSKTKSITERKFKKFRLEMQEIQIYS